MPVKKKPAAKLVLSKGVGTAIREELHSLQFPTAMVTPPSESDSGAVAPSVLSPTDAAPIDTTYTSTSS